MSIESEYLDQILFDFIPGQIQKMNIIKMTTPMGGPRPLTPTAKLTLVELRLTSISKKLDTLIAQYDKSRDVTAKSHFQLFQDDIDKLIEL